MQTQICYVLSDCVTIYSSGTQCPFERLLIILMEPREDRQDAPYEYDRATKPRPGSPLTLRGYWVDN